MRANRDLVLDAALVGMLRARLRLFRNLMFAVAKLLFVVVAVGIVTPEDWQVTAIVASWVIGQGVGPRLAGVFGFKRRGYLVSAEFDALSRRTGCVLALPRECRGARPDSHSSRDRRRVAVSGTERAILRRMEAGGLAGVVPSALATVLFSVGWRFIGSLEPPLLTVPSLGVGVVAAVDSGSCRV